MLRSIVCIIATEFCERFSFCGLRTILSLYLRNVLCLPENTATVVYHIFVMLCYTMPLIGAVLADNYLGRYKVVLCFSIVHFFGTVLVCLSAIPPLNLPPTATSMCGLLLIAAGTGGVKPCVAAFGGDQFHLPREHQELQKFFSTFYYMVNLGGLIGMVVMPALRRSVMCFGDDSCYALGFGLSSILVLISIAIFMFGKSSYRIKKPTDSITKFLGCAWFALKMRFSRDTKDEARNRDHWLDYAEEEYGGKLVSDMKIVCSIVYLYLPVPIFWSLFDQQGSRWTFQASRLRSEIFGINLMPDQLQVLSPALVLLMIPVCPGGICPLMPDLPPLHKMFVGGILTALAFIASGILQIGIERSTLQPPGAHSTGLVFLNTLPCSMEVSVEGESLVPIDHFGTALMFPLPHQSFVVSVNIPPTCGGRVMKTNYLKQRLKTVAEKFMPIIIGQDSNDKLEFYYMDANTFTKSITGKPMLKVVYVGETGPDKNVSITIETDKSMSDIYYISDAPVNHIGESAFMCMSPGKFTWHAQSEGGGAVSGAGEGHVRAGGVYVLCLRERLGRLDAAVLHAPNPPNELHVVWITPQYVLISAAEIMFAVSGLEFSFTQAPRSLKTITLAAWYVSVAIGNLIVILVTQTKIFDSRSTEFFVYAGTLILAMLMFLHSALNYTSVDYKPSTESEPLLAGHKAMSIHSLGAAAVPSGRSAAAMYGLVEAWPTGARVNLGTPTSNDAEVTTLAK